MEETRIGSIVSSQIGRMGAIDLSEGEFRLPDGMAFNIKNDGADAVELDVILDKMAEGDYVTTKFYPGWNMEIVRAVKSDDTVTGLFWGV